MIYLYRAIRAVLPTPGDCRFFPTCSHYAQEAIRKYGARRGTYLALHRFFRCHPANLGGLDPVP